MSKQVYSPFHKRWKSPRLTWCSLASGEYDVSEVCRSFQWKGEDRPWRQYGHYDWMSRAGLGISQKELEFVKYDGGTYLNSFAQGLSALSGRLSLVQGTA